MTFSDWYAANIAPGLEETIKTYKPELKIALRLASRQAMAACWNAALQTVYNQRFTREEFPQPCRLPAEILEQIMGLGA